MSEPTTLEEIAHLAAIPPKTAFRLLSLGKNSGYAALHRGEIPSVVIAGRTMVPSVPFLRLVGAESLVRPVGDDDESRPAASVASLPVRGRS